MTCDSEVRSSASDPVISKHLARFLTRSLQNVQASDELGALVGSRAGGPALMPTAVLFNGGVFKAGHLTSAQKRDLISKVLKARPEGVQRHGRQANHG